MRKDLVYGQALSWIFLKHALDQVFDLGTHLRAQRFLSEIDRVPDDLLFIFFRVRMVEGQRLGEDCVEDDAESKDVNGAVVPSAEQHLRRKVALRPDFKSVGVISGHQLSRASVVGERKRRRFGVLV